MLVDPPPPPPPDERFLLSAFSISFLFFNEEIGLKERFSKAVPLLLRPSHLKLWPQPGADAFTTPRNVTTRGGFLAPPPPLPCVAPGEGGGPGASVRAGQKRFDVAAADPSERMSLGGCQSPAPSMWSLQNGRERTQSPAPGSPPAPALPGPAGPPHPPGCPRQGGGAFPSWGQGAGAVASPGPSPPPRARSEQMPGKCWGRGG